jgi:hypothetical protein
MPCWPSVLIVCLPLKGDLPRAATPYIETSHQYVKLQMLQQGFTEDAAALNPLNSCGLLFGIGSKVRANAC